MKKTVNQILSFAISWTLMFAPSLGFAQTATTTPSTGQQIGSILNTTLTTTAGVLDVVTQQKMMAQQHNQYNMQLMSLVPNPHGENFLGKQCPVMQSRSNRPYMPFCKVDDDMSMQMAEQMLLLAQENVNAFENFETPEAPGAPTGLTCLEDGIRFMDNQLQERMKQLTEMKNQVDDMRRNFETQANLDKENIRRIEGIISGKDIDENELTTLYNDAFNDNKCRSIFVDDSGFKSAARDGVAGKKGLNGLLAHIEDEKSGTIPGAGKQGDLADYIRRNANTIKQDIKRTANNLRDHLNNVGVAGIDSKDKTGGFESNFTSKFQIEQSDVYKDVIGNNFGQFASKKKSLENNVEKLGVKNSAIASALTNPNTDFNQALQDWKNQTYTQCINNQIGDLGSFAKNFRTNNTRLSDRATRGKDLQEYIASVLGDSSVSLDERVKRIKQYAADKGYSDMYYFSKSATGPVSDVTRSSNDIAANGTSSNTQVRSVSNIMDNYLASCHRVYKSTRYPGSQYSGSEIEQNLSNLRTGYQTMVNDYQNNVAEQLINRMVNCEGTPVANSCDKSQLNFSSNSSFCLKTATTCAQNMKSCEEKVQKVITAKVKEKQGIAQQYNQNFKRYTDDNFKLFKVMEQQVKDLAPFYQSFMAEAPIMPPLDLTGENMKLDIPVEKFNKELGVNLLDEKDIKKYLTNLNNRYDAMIKGVEAQNKKMIALAEKRKGDIMANIQKDKQFWSGVVEGCNGAIEGFVDQSNQQIAAQNQQNQEQMGKVGDFCGKYNTIAAADNPAAGCDGMVDDLYESSMAISGQLSPTAMQRVLAYKNYCKSFNNESNNSNSGDVELTRIDTKKYPAIPSSLKLSSSNLVENFCTNSSNKDIEKIRVYLVSKNQLSCDEWTREKRKKKKEVTIRIKRDDGEYEERKEEIDPGEEYENKIATALISYNSSYQLSKDSSSNTYSQMGELPSLTLCTASNNAVPGYNAKGIYTEMADVINRGIAAGMGQ